MSSLNVQAYKKTFMMCEPTNYGIWDPGSQGFANKYQEEGWKAYTKDPDGYVQAALEDWYRIKETIETEADVVLLPTMENTDTDKYYDQVFTADASLSMITSNGAVTLLSQFTNTERNPEVKLHEEFIKAVDGKKGFGSDRIIKASPYNIEGTGDNVYDAYRDMFWSGYTFDTDRSNASEGRSDKRSHLFLRAATGTRVNSMETREGFFHQDTSLSPLPRGHIVFYPGGVDKRHLESFKKAAFDDFELDRDTHLLQIDSHDANAYACNLLYIGNNKIIVTEATSEKFREQLRSAEYDVIALSAKYLRDSGGAFHCITNPIYERKVDGGYHGIKMGWDLAPK